LERAPGANGKYKKMGNKKDTEIIRWIFMYSGYLDSLTSSLYVEWIETNIMEKSIQDYISRAKSESR
jgi:hypothetical protein